jgi:hypothetical protein
MLVVLCFLVPHEVGLEISESFVEDPQDVKLIHLLVVQRGLGQDFWMIAPRWHHVDDLMFVSPSSPNCILSDILNLDSSSG